MFATDQGKAGLLQICCRWRTILFFELQYSESIAECAVTGCQAVSVWNGWISFSGLDSKRVHGDSEPIGGFCGCVCG